LMPSHSITRCQTPPYTGQSARGGPPRECTPSPP
jgi:hypothetical protein